MDNHVIVLDSDSDNDSDLMIIEDDSSRGGSVFAGNFKKRPSSSLEIIPCGQSAEILPLSEPLPPLKVVKHTDGGIFSSLVQRRATEVDALKEEFGEDDSGWGLKVELLEVAGERLISTVSVSVMPLLNRHNDLTDTFALVIVNGAKNEQVHGFQHFPPVRVRVEYTSIEENTAKFIVNCSWLLKEHVKRLSTELLREFNQSQGSLTKALRWLESRSIKSLGILKHRRLFYVSPDVLDRKPYHIVFTDPNAVRAIFADVRAKRESFDHASLLVSAKTFDCAVCFERRPGMAAIIFPDCHHFFCRTCVAQDMSLKINEGQLKDLTCLHHGCKIKADCQFVKTMVNFTIFQRYCDLTTEQFVDESAVIIRCPRKECNVPMEMIPNGQREIQCLTCGYHFCSTCKAQQHPDTPCLTDEQKKEIRDSWKGADENQRKELQKKFGPDNIKFAFEDADSEEWISKNAKPCPKCKTPIQKIDGCNKMICTSKGCKTYFCWLCGCKLSDGNPYQHFQAGSACAGKLHELPNGANPLGPHALVYNQLIGELLVQGPAPPLPMPHLAPLARRRVARARVAGPPRPRLARAAARANANALGAVPVPAPLPAGAVMQNHYFPQQHVNPYGLPALLPAHQPQRLDQVYANRFHVEPHANVPYMQQQLPEPINLHVDHQGMNQIIGGVVIRAINGVMGNAVINAPHAQERYLNHQQNDQFGYDPPPRPRVQFLIAGGGQNPEQQFHQQFNFVGGGGDPYY